MLFRWAAFLTSTSSSTVTRLSVGVLLHPRLEDAISEGVEEWGRRVGRLKGDFESFVKGEHMALSMTPFEHKTAFMGANGPNYGWYLGNQKPRPKTWLAGLWKVRLYRHIRGPQLGAQIS